MSEYKHIEVRRLSGALGAEISGVDLSRPLDEEVFAEVRRALAEYLVIGFRNQDLTPDQQCAFTARWGNLTSHPFVKNVVHPDVLAIIRQPDDTVANFGGVWHSDTTFIELPPAETTLYGVDIPPYGGDTLFSNCYMSYDALSPGMQRLADTLVVMHSAANGYDPYRGANDPTRSNVMQRGMPVQVNDDVSKEMPHPLVRVHPVTGRKALWTAGGYCLRFADMTEEESRPLLDFFHQHARNPNFTTRWSWTKGALLMWDNRVTNHFAINDYSGFRREVHRVQVEGERPFGPALPQESHAVRSNVGVDEGADRPRRTRLHLA